MQKNKAINYFRFRSKTYNLFFIFIAGTFTLFLFSCRHSGEKHPSTENLKLPDSAVTSIAIKPKSGPVNYKFHPHRKDTPWKGNIVATANWKDANGNNVVIISTKVSDSWFAESPEMKKFASAGNDCELAQLFAYHYFLNDSSERWKLNWTLNDFEFSCTDTDLLYFKGSLAISDVDSNGIAESCFAYYENYNLVDLNYTIKLISHVNSTKLKVYGAIGKYKYIVEEWDKTLLTPVYSKSFDSIATIHRKYASEMWDKYSNEQDSLDKLQIKEWEHP